MQSDLNGDGTYSIKTKVDSIGWADVIRIIVEDNMQAGKEMSQEIRQNAIEDSENGNPMFGRTRGVLSNSEIARQLRLDHRDSGSGDRLNHRFG